MSVVKKTIVLSISIIFLLVFCASAFLMPKTVKATEIVLPEIKNSSFEQLEPFGWQVNADEINGQNHGITSQVFYDGTSSYQLKQNVYTIKSADFIDVDIDSGYVVGVKIFCSEIGSACKIGVQSFDQNGESLNTNYEEEFLSSKKGAWQDVRLNFQTQQNACKIKVIIEVDATSGDVCIDNVYAHKDFVHIYDGASINLQTSAQAMSVKAQLRFTGKIDKDSYDEFLNAYPDAEAGFALVTTLNLEQAGEFTFKSFLDAGKESKILKVVSTRWTNLYTADEDGFYTLDFALPIEEIGRYKTNISVRAYIKFYENGVEKYIFSNYDESVNSRSVYSVAVMAKADTNTYKNYSAGQKEKIDAYIDGREPIMENLD